MEILFFVVCFLASIVGAICGIGGGVIIKPLLDALQFLDVSQISFLSGCTVLSMSTYSVIKSKLSGKKEVDIATVLPVGIGGAIGGIVGKWLFSFIKSLSDNPNKVGVVQAACLLIVTVFTLVYTVFKDRITTKKLRGLPILMLVGLLLGIMSSFLGIGGGPINLVVLFYLFSMTTKEAVIFISHIASLATSIITNTVPEFPVKVLVVMVAGGILGGVVGRIVNKKIADKTVDKLFIGLMAVMIAINIYNIFGLV